MENLLIPLSEAIKNCNNLPSIKYLYLGIPNTPGVTLIVGKAKSGKSIFMENMAYALLDKDTTHFLGHEIATVDRIAILSYEEMLRNRTERQIRQLTTRKSINVDYIVENLYVFNDNRKGKTSKKVTNQLKKFKPEVVFIDSLGKLANKPIEKSNYAQKLMNKLRLLSDILECPVIILHHTVKGNLETQDLSTVAGSRVVGQEADSIYGLYVNSSSKVRILKPIALRYAKEENLELRFTIDDSCLLQETAPPTISFSIPPTQQRKEKVLNYICSSSNVKTENVIHYLKSNFNIQKTSAYNELKRLNLQQDEKGCYICPKPPSIENDGAPSPQHDSSEREQ